MGQNMLSYTEVYCIRFTEKAYMVLFDDVSVWLPASQVLSSNVVETCDTDTPYTMDLEIPEWLAIAKEIEDYCD